MRSPLLAHRLAPEPLHHALGKKRLLACGFRNRLILHAVDEVPRTARKTALLQRALPARHRTLHHACAALFAPLAHVGHVNQRAVGDRLHPLALATGATVHTGGDGQIAAAEMVFGVPHLALRGDLQRAARKRRLAAAEPQRGIYQMQIIIQQREAQVMRANAVGAVFIHAQRRPAPSAFFRSR